MLGIDDRLFTDDRKLLVCSCNGEEQSGQRPDRNGIEGIEATDGEGGREEREFKCHFQPLSQVAKNFSFFSASKKLASNELRAISRNWSSVNPNVSCAS